MKKSIKISLFLLTMVFVICGCAMDLGMNTDLKMDKAYSFNATVTYGNLSASAYFERFSQGRWNVSLTEPYELQGLSLYFKDGKAKATFAGITVDLSSSSDIASIAEKIISTVENAIRGEGIEAIKSGEVIEISGMTEFGAYKLVLDSKTKHPISAAIPDQDLRITFSNVTISEISEPDIIDNV